jgi:hypothetical protein
MMIGDLIAELQKFPELSTVFILVDEPRAGEINRLDSTQAIWVNSSDGSGIHGPFAEVAADTDEPAEDYGVLLYG